MAAHQKPNAIRLIAVDIDGTLLNSDLQLSARNEETLRRVTAQGIHVILATGKSRVAGEDLIKRLNITSPGIYLQGLCTYDSDGGVIRQQILDPAIARQAITFAEDRDFVVIAYSSSRILVRKHDDRILEGTVRYHESMPEAIGPLQNIVGELPLNKLLLIGEPTRIKALRWQLNAQLGSACRLMQAGVPDMLEVLPPGASKGHALKLLINDMGIAPDHVMALGDAENDIEMIELAGIGVAMGQASQHVKDSADYVTGTNDEDGVAQAVERFVLKTEADQPRSEDGAGPRASKSEASAAETTAEESKA